MKNIIIIGAGGHSRVLIETIISTRQYKIIGVTDIKKELWGKEIYHGIKVIGDDRVLKKFSPKNCAIAIGIGEKALPQKRRSIYQMMIYEKIGHTSQKYPRKPVKIKKHPL